MMQDVLDVPLQAGEGDRDPALGVEYEQLDTVPVHQRWPEVHAEPDGFLQRAEPGLRSQEAVAVTENHSPVRRVRAQPGRQVIARVVGDGSGAELTLPSFLPWRTLQPGQLGDAQRAFV